MVIAQFGLAVIVCEVPSPAIVLGEALQPVIVHVTVGDPLGLTVNVIGCETVETTKVAVIVPLPPIVAVVDADEELANVMDPVLLLHKEKA